MNTVMTAVENPGRFHCRWMIRRDMNRIVEIDRACFDLVWSNQDFAKVLRRQRSVGYVIEVGDRVVGYMIYELSKTHVSLIRIAVHPYYQRLGLATRMIEYGYFKRPALIGEKLNVIVDERNLSAQLFFKSLKPVSSKLVRLPETAGGDVIELKFNRA